MGSDDSSTYLLLKKDLPGAVKILESKYNSNRLKNSSSEQTGNYAYRLGVCYFYQEEYAKAIPVLETSVKALEESKGNSSIEATRSKLWLTRAKYFRILNAENGPGEEIS